jgi:hypothetical protein
MVGVDGDDESDDESNLTNSFALKADDDDSAIIVPVTQPVALICILINFFTTLRLPEFTSMTVEEL